MLPLIVRSMKQVSRIWQLVSITQILLAGTIALPVAADDAKKKTRDEMVLEDRDTLADNAHWTYNDLTKAFSEAEKSGRPLIVVHRCIP